MRIALFISAVFLAILPAQADDWLYLTVPGDTLSGIGQTYLRNPKDWPKVQSSNNVPIPKHLPANSRLKIPVELLKQTPAPVEVIAIKGTPRFKRADSPFQPLKQGMLLTGGETVLTGPGASVNYRFADETQLTQQASSKLNFGRLQGYGKTGMVSTEISLDSGRLEARAGKQRAPAGGFNVRTPVAVAGLRGTEFRLSVAEDGQSMRNEVIEGAVAVSAQGEEVRVEGGYGTFAEQGKPPAAPVSLLPKPDLTALPANIMRLPFDFAWPTQTAARAWRVQLSDESDFLTVTYDQVVDQPSAHWQADLPDATYYLRVRGIDSLGLEGYDSVHTFNLNARPFPPSALAPVLGAHLNQLEVELTWTAAETAQGFLLQLSPTPEFGNGLIERRLSAVTQTRETLTEGDWHWRLASLDAQGQARAFSPHRAFRIELPPPPAEPAPPAQPSLPLVKDEGSHLLVIWQGAAPAYRLELSTNEAFNPMISTTLLATPAARILKPAAGNYWLRVIALDADKRESPPSPSATIVLQSFKPWWLLPLLFFAP